MRTTLIILALATSCVLAQVPHRCITPAQWASKIVEYNHGQDYENRFYLTYDATNKRVRRIDEIHAHSPGRKFYDVIELYNQNARYIVDLNSNPRTCKKETLTRPFYYFGIPPNAQFDGEVSIGSPNSNVLVNSWGERLPRGGQWVGTFTNMDCIPVHEVDARNISTSITIQYYDTVLGISDPNTFIPPRECLGL